MGTSFDHHLRFLAAGWEPLDVALRVNAVLYKVENNSAPQHEPMTGVGIDGKLPVGAGWWWIGPYKDRLAPTGDGYWHLSTASTYEEAAALAVVFERWCGFSNLSVEGSP